MNNEAYTIWQIEDQESLGHEDRFYLEKHAKKVISFPSLDQALTARSQAPQEPIFLVSNYSNQLQQQSQFKDQLLKFYTPRENTIGIIVQSGFHQLAHSLQTVQSKAFSSQIPLVPLEKPYAPQLLGEALQQLEKMKKYLQLPFQAPMPAAETLIRPKEQDPQAIIDSALKILDLNFDDLIFALIELGAPREQVQLLQKQGSFTMNDGSALWLTIERALCLPKQTLFWGYDARRHLRGLFQDLKKKEVRFPISLDLLKTLVDDLADAPFPPNQAAS